MEPMKLYKIILGVLFLASVAYAYHDVPQYLYEGTAVSNTLAGFLLIADGALSGRKKRVPGVIYLAETCFIMTVYTVTTFATAFSIYEGFSFKGGFMLLHAVNPLVFLAVYLFGTRHQAKSKKETVRYTFLAPSLITAYLIFDFVRWLLTGNFVYGLIPEDAALPFVLLFGAAACALEALFGFSLLKLKNRINSVYNS